MPSSSTREPAPEGRESRSPGGPGVATPAPQGGLLRDAARQVSAGIVAASLTIPFCVGAGVLAFAPLGPDWVARGAVSGVVGAIVGGIVSAIFRHSSFVVSFPTTPICVIQASVLASIVALRPGDPEGALAALLLCVVSVGLWQVLFALSGLSRVIRFVPHPVMAGFVSGVAVLIAWHQVPALLGVRQLDGAFAAGPVPHPAATLFGAALLAGILLAGRLAPRLPNLLLGLVVGTAAFHLALFVAPGTFLGATIGKMPAGALGFWPLSHAGDVATVFADGRLLRTVLVGSLTLAVVGTLDTFFALRAAQLLSNVEIDPKRDVFGQGMGNLASALAGPLVVSPSLSVSMANHRAGGRTRISTIASGLALLAGALLFPSVVGRLPLVVLGAILVATSLRLVDRWSFQVLRLALTSGDRVKRRQALRDGSVILTVFLATILGRPVFGVAVGFSLACLLFVIDMSRPVVAGRRNGTDYRSKRLRSFPQREVLTQRGRSIAVLELKGALFFGNSHGLASDVQALGEDARFVVLDCRHLRDVDTSGVTTLVQIAGRLRGRRRFLLAAGTNPGWFDGHADLPGREAIRFFPTREAALSWAEDQILAEEAELRGEPLRSGSLILASGAANLFEEAVKSGRLEAVRFGKGEALCKAGDPGDRMWILKSGTVAIFAPGDPGSLFLARLGPGSPVGEMGLMSQTGRAADAVAEKDVEAYLLTEEAFSRILLEEPGLGQTILLLVAKHLADRLRETTEDLKSADSVV